MKQYRAFRPANDMYYSKSGYSKLRDAEAVKIISETETFDLSILKDLKDPFVSAFSFNEKSMLSLTIQKQQGINGIIVSIILSTIEQRLITIRSLHLFPSLKEQETCKYS